MVELTFQQKRERQAKGVYSDKEDALERGLTDTSFDFMKNSIAAYETKLSIKDKGFT